jgi:hypothetical protein
MKYLLKVKENMTLYLGPVEVGNLRGTIENAYAFDTYKDASWLRAKYGLKSRYSIVEMSEKDLFAARLKGK